MLKLLLKKPIDNNQILRQTKYLLLLILIKKIDYSKKKLFK